VLDIVGGGDTGANDGKSERPATEIDDADGEYFERAKE
jgi:hypothetical protein